MAKHGAEDHFLRPDGVYITSVLQPTVGYDPVGDAQAVGARFVAPMGLAGPKATAWRARRRGLRGPVVDGLRARWQMFKARIKANLQSHQFLLTTGTAPSSAPVITVNTSPSAAADPSAVGGPAGQTPAGAAAAVYAAAPGDPASQGAMTTSVAMAPQETGVPAGIWQQIINSGAAPVVALRAEADALRKWFSRT